MENKENKIKAVKLSDDELENVSGGSSKTTVSGVTCSNCGATINGTAYMSVSRFRCLDCGDFPAMHVLS